ncbi:hypothetical protein [Massilia suwonensis]|uniref:Uncharacterized protein n=1 Tax=Massilia suwonensis TaxID=648895 RepID=A0ABW0ML25_9BURK
MKQALSLLLFVSGAALADDAAVLKCRALPDAASRLACYDAMPVGAAPALAAAPATAPATAPIAAPAVAATPEQRFGLNPVVQKKQEAQADTIQSTVAGKIDGWSVGSRITLANGQVWRVIEGDAVLPALSNPKAEVSRGLLGAYFLQIVGHNSTARVKRVQ